MNQLDSLRQFTTVVADTGDFESMASLKPTDATTNPSLILKAIQKDTYKPLLYDVIQQHGAENNADILDHLLVRFGQKILEIVPGRVSTEVDARLSFDTEKTVQRAHQLIQTYEKAGIDRSRVLIKIASTWEGIEAAKILGQDNIKCNMTLLFCMAQAIACAQAKVQLISPFVGRIYDWHKKNMGAQWDESLMSGSNDPGVRSVAAIFNYYKSHNVKTEIMGASFRNVGQIIALTGCDLLTISPDLLQQLMATEGELTPNLDAERSRASNQLPRVTLNEAEFRFMLNQDAMASEKLSEGIRAFVTDTLKLDQIINAARH